MRTGQISFLFCPHALDNGGSRDNYKLNGSGWIDEGTDLFYEFDVLGCGPEVDPNLGYEGVKTVKRPLKTDACMFITLEGAE